MTGGGRLTLLNRVMSRLEAEDDQEGDPPSSNHLKGYLTGEQPQLSYAETAAHLGMSEGAVKVAVHRLRRQFRDLVRDEIAQTVESPEDVEDELRHLWSAVGRALSGGFARAEPLRSGSWPRP